MTIDAQEAARAVAERLEDAWNTANGVAWGAEFTGDADFIGFKGRRATTQTVIADDHQRLFDAECAGRRMQFEVVQARHVGEDVILAHMRQILSGRTGREDDVQSAVGTTVLVRVQDRWRIAAYHNSLERETREQSD